MRRKNNEDFEANRSSKLFVNENNLTKIAKGTLVTASPIKVNCKKEPKVSSEKKSLRYNSKQSESENRDEPPFGECPQVVPNLKKLMKSKVPQISSINHSVDIKPNTMIYDFSLYDVSEKEKLIAVMAKNEVHFLLYTKTVGGEEVNNMKTLRKLEISFENQSPKDVEEFYSCDFGLFYKSRRDITKVKKNIEADNCANEDMHLVLCAGGKAGSLFVIFVFEKEIIEMKSNHNDIYSIKFPRKNNVFDFRNLVLCSYKDSMIILWNIEKRVQVANFIPLEGRFVDTTSVDWHSSHTYFAAGGIDGCVNFWSITEEVKKAINLCNELFIDTASHCNVTNSKFPTVKLTTNFKKIADAHDNYVDDVHFYNDLIISRDVERNIAMWLPFFALDTHFTLKKWSYYMYELIYFTKMTIHQEAGILLLGNDCGEVYFCLLDPDHEKTLGVQNFDENLPICKMILYNETVVVRKAILSRDLDVIFCISDSGKLWYQEIDCKIIENLTKCK